MNRPSILALLLTISVILAGCDNGSAPDSAAEKSSGLVKVCLSVDGETSGVQKTVSVNSTDWASFKYQYKATPQWSGTDIQGEIGWTEISCYEAGVSLGYFTPGKWVFGVRVLSGATVIYEGFSDVIEVKNDSVDVDVSVTTVSVRSVHISVTAPTASNESLSISYSGGAVSAIIDSRQNNTTLFEYTVPNLDAGRYTFTLTHQPTGCSESIEIQLPQNGKAEITGSLENNVWDLDSSIVQARNITIKKYNWDDGSWGTGSSPDYYGATYTNIASAVPGERVSFLAKPVSKSRVYSLSLEYTDTGADIDIVFTKIGELYSFIMPEGNVTVKVKFSKVNLAEIDTLLFTTIVRSLYSKFNTAGMSFGRSNSAPDDENDKPVKLGDDSGTVVKLWYNSGANKICWYSTSDIALSEGSLANLFYGGDKYVSISLDDIDASKVTSLSGMFDGCTNLTTLTFGGFAVNTTDSVNMARLFKDCGKLTGVLNLSNFAGSKASDMAEMFHGCAKVTGIDLSDIDTSNAASMEGLFQGCTMLANLDLTGCNANSARSVANMFYGCTSLTSLSLAGFTINTTSSVNMAGMFRDCVGLTGTLDLSSFDTTKATDMSYMFCGCRGLTGIDLSGFHTGNVTDMTCMFSSLAEAQEYPPAMNLTSLNVSGFDTKNVRNMRQMFYLCYKLSALDVSGFKTTKVTDMSYMFACYNYKQGNNNSPYPGKLTTLNLSGWDFTNVTTTAHMFDRQEKLDSGLTFPAVTNFASLTTMTYMFSQCLALTPSTFTKIVNKWTFAGQGGEWRKNVYGIGLTDNSDAQKKTLFGNHENSSTGLNSGANYIFRENTMTASGKNFFPRAYYETADDYGNGNTNKIRLYIGGGSSQKHARLTTKETP
ncbi:MAG: BspA family leucine-rich repeat surface protein [Spirochaetia bacterium]|nr:BspA family leucine-rich repeat surface protein [Spirochaetia bacterium]